jgi:hypothetical protein
LLAGALLALLALPHGQVWAQALSKDQQNCVNQINKNFANVAKAQAQVISTCISAGSKDQLEAQTIEACMTADNSGKVDKAEQKTLDKERRKCLAKLEQLPHFGFAGAAVANQVAIAKELSLVHAIFGNDLDDPNQGIQLSFFNKNTAKCQLDVAKAAQKCQGAKLNVFNSCKKGVLKGKGGPAIESAQQLQDACLGIGTNPMPDPQRKIVKACEDKLGDTTAKKCVNAKGVDLARAFPGFDPSDNLQADIYIAQKIECEFCLAINAVDDLSRDCDLFDDGLANFSCGLGPPP